MAHLEELMNDFLIMGSTTTNLVYSTTQSLRGPARPSV